MSYNPADLFALLPKLGEAIKSAVDQYSALKASGCEVTPDILAMGLTMRLSSWQPMVRGKPVLDEATKAAMCRFLAGVGFNLAQ